MITPFHLTSFLKENCSTISYLVNLKTLNNNGFLQHSKNIHCKKSPPILCDNWETEHHKDSATFQNSFGMAKNVKTPIENLRFFKWCATNWAISSECYTAPRSTKIKWVIVRKWNNQWKNIDFQIDIIIEIILRSLTPHSDRPRGRCFQKKISHLCYISW